MPDPIWILQINDGKPINLTVNEPESFTFDMVIAGAVAEHYIGDTEITPTEAEQVLSTTGLVVDDDITVHAIQTQTGTAIPTEDEQIIEPDEGKYLKSVTVEGIDPSYVGSNVPRVDALTVQDDTVTAPAGYYAEAISATVDGGSVTMPSPIITATPTITVDASGSITASVNASTTVTPSVIPGWVTSAESGTVTAAGTATEHLDTVPGTTIIPNNSQHTAIQRGQYATGDIVVDAVPTETQSVSPSTSAQTVTPSANHYLSQVDVAAMPAGNKGGSATTSVTQDSSYKYYTTNWTGATNGYYAASAFNPASQIRFQRQNATVTPDSTTQTVTPTGAYYYIDKVTVNPIPPEYIVPSGTLSVTSNGTGIDCSTYESVDVAVPSGQPSLQNKSKSYTPTESAQSESITADAGYDGLGTVSVSVDAISSTYVGSGVARNSSSDLTASGATVTAPAGYYANAASKAVSSGSATPAATISATGATVSTGTNTLTLSKTVSNTPQVSAGYISSGTAGNSSVSLTATVTTQAAQTIHPSTSNQTIASGRYLTGTQTINAVTTTNLVAGNIKDGVTIQIGDSSDSDCVASVTGTYTGGGGSSKNVQIASGVDRVATTSYTAVNGQSITVAKTGTYNVYWVGFRSSTGGTNGSQLYIGSTAYGSAQTTFTNHGQSIHLSNVSLTQNQVVTVRARARGTNYYMYVGNLTIIEA